MIIALWVFGGIVLIISLIQLGEALLELIAMALELALTLLCMPIAWVIGIGGFILWKIMT